MLAVLAAAFVLSHPALDPEAVRIQRHLARVEAELRRAGDAGLPAPQRRWRAQLVDELHRYWTRGRFPRNTLVERVSPVLVDRDGTRCAVAELIAASGRGDLVARLAATRNTSYVAELADDVELVGWLDEHGLTAAEAARIQPTYQPVALPVGEYCADNAMCESNLCVAADEQLRYCSRECDQAPCPVGRAGVPMECDRTHPRHLCRYPSPAPGAMGWPCGDDPASCAGVCLTAEPTPTCTYRCSHVDDCPDGHECRSRDDSDGWAVCVAEPGDRCAIGAGRGGSLAAALALLLLTGRRGGRAR